MFITEYSVWMYGHPLVKMSYIYTLLLGVSHRKTLKRFSDKDPSKNPYLSIANHNDQRTSFGTELTLSTFWYLTPQHIREEDRVDVIAHNGLRFDIDSCIPISTTGVVGERFAGARKCMLFSVNIP